MTYKKGDTVSLLSFDRKETGKAKVKSVVKAKPNKFGIQNYYITNKGTFSDMEVDGTPAYKLRFRGNTEKEVIKALNRGERPGLKSLLSLVNQISFHLQPLEFHSYMLLRHRVQDYKINFFLN